MTLFSSLTFQIGSKGVFTPKWESQTFSANMSKCKKITKDKQQAALFAWVYRIVEAIISEDKKRSKTTGQDRIVQTIKKGLG